jgi:hypothetical protein
MEAAVAGEEGEAGDEAVDVALEQLKERLCIMRLNLNPAHLFSRAANII